MRHLALLVVLATFAGCANRSYELTSTDGSSLKVKSWTFLTWGRLSSFSATKTGVRVGANETGTEAEKLAPLIEAAAAGAARGALK